MKITNPTLFALVLAILLAGCQTKNEQALTTPSGPQLFDNIVKSPTDKRSYRFLTLENGLKVLLISDPEADKSAAAMDISAGAFQTPKDRPGLLHFLEHMLFLGTEKYPDAGEYNEYLKKNGGGSNAYTAEEDTNYFFDVKNEAFDGALDRFAQFFISPTLDPQFVDREKNAVDSEYSLKIKDESRRIREAGRQVINPNHPYSVFSVGNLETLADRENNRVYDALIAVYQRHYSANRMALVVLSNSSLDALQTSVIEKFSAVKNNGMEKAKIDVPYLTKNELATRVNIVPLREMRSLDLTFPITDTQQYIDKKPTLLISALLGHEGQNSLYQLLNQQGLIESLSASTVNSEALDLFNLNMDLTSKGLVELNTVMQTIFAYIDLIKQKGVKQAYYDELKNIAALNFNFQEAVSPTTTVYSLSPMLQNTSAASLLNIDYTFAEFDAALIQDYLSQLNPQNMQMTVVAPGLPTNKKEPLYDVDYSTQKIPTTLLTQWAQVKAYQNMQLPTLNPFIAQDTSLKKETSQIKPNLLVERPGLVLWHYQDTSFAIPKADIYVRIESALAGDTVEHRAMLALARKLIEDKLNAFGYDARLAGLGYSLSESDRGLGYTVTGYNDKQARLISTINQTINEFDISETKFDLIKTSLLRDWNNAALDRPISQVFARRTREFGSDPYSQAQKAVALQNINLGEVKGYMQSFLAKVALQVMVHGNVSDSEALTLGDNLYAAFLSEGRNGKGFSGGLRTLAKGETAMVELDIDNQDSAIAITYPIDASLAGLTKSRMLAQVLSAAFFNDIRTTQQLGYVAGAFSRDIRELATMNFYIQSSKVGPAELQRRIEAFIQQQYIVIQAMSEEEFAQHKAGLISDIDKKDKNLLERTGRLWGELDDGYLDFDKTKQLSAAVENMTKNQLVDIYKNLLIDTNKGRLISRNFGYAHRDADFTQAQQDKTICRVEQCWQATK
jgi:insulysin